LPKTLNLSNLGSDEESKGEIVKIKKLGGNHICKDSNSQQSQSQEVNSEDIVINEEREDDEEVKNFIRSNPLRGTIAIKDWCKSKKLKASYTKIKRFLYNIRQELFPSDKEMVLSKPYSSTRGELGGGFNLVRYRGTSTNEKEETSEVIIFSSPCLLKLLSYPNWFVDGTFKIAANGYRQLLIIIVHHPIFGCYLPSCFILMSSKSFNNYALAFSNLQLKCEELGVKLDPQYLMCDFESALRKGLRKFFPKATIAGCYFHYCKALWHYMGSHSLTTKERLHDSIKLITFLKILAHIEISERKPLFDELCVMFKKKDSKFMEMLNYFERNWLNTFYVESMKIGEEDESQLIARTNNVCEVYNHILNKKVSITNPSNINFKRDMNLVLFFFLYKGIRH